MALSLRFALCVLLTCPLGALCQAGAHPTRIDEKSNCLECHAEYAAGDHVHPAVQRGCISCHSVEQRDDATYVVLKPTKSVICLECHPMAALVNPHFPYASGMCLRCHTPHSSPDPGLLRAKVNQLCLDCHLLSPKNASSRYMPLIELTADNRRGHPLQNHPVCGTRDPLSGTEMSCISCHRAHGGGKLHYLKMGSEIPEDALNQNTETKDMCRKCHLALWGLDDNASGRKRNRKKRGN